MSKKTEKFNPLLSLGTYYGLITGIIISFLLNQSMTTEAIIVVASALIGWIIHSFIKLKRILVPFGMMGFPINKIK